MNKKPDEIPRGFDTLDEALEAIAEHEETKRRREISSRWKKLKLSGRDSESVGELCDARPRARP
jgi:hypothetical protein